MKKNRNKTPRSRIRQCLRQLWLRSRERAAAIRRDKYTCVHCGRKQSKAKGKEFAVMVHHKNKITNWDVVIDAVFKEILCNPDELETICNNCHLEIHKKEGKK